MGSESLVALMEVDGMKTAIMQAWQPKGIGNDPPSLTVFNVNLKIASSKESLTLPIYHNTKVLEVKSLLVERLGVDLENLRFVHKQGSHFRTSHDHDECPRHVIVHGIKGFKRSVHVWEHPHCIIGAGHIGLKMAMTWVMEGRSDFVVYDRNDRVGGTSWINQANTTSRLQTEVGVYHLEYHENNGWPAEAIEQPWPSRDGLLAHFHEVSERFGLLPYCKMNSNVSSINIVGKDVWTQTYELSVKQKGKGEEIATYSSVSFFPGNLTRPKRVTYPGEDGFAGDIVYGISSSFDYSKCRDSNVVIVGSGAFAVENVRTCVEYMAKKVFMVCRRKTLSMPRVVSWLINQSHSFCSASLTLDSMSPMYDLIGVDQWSYYSVFTNESRTNTTIRQKARFGIGDVYFLAMAAGHTEHIVDDIKRVTEDSVHLNNGRKLEKVTAMLKLLGFNGEFENDRLLKIKELHGWWPQKDFKRYIVAEPIFVDANNFGGTSFSPGAITWAENQVHILKYPKDFAPFLEGNMLPMHVADEEGDRPAYVVEARHGSLVGITLGAVIRGIGERGNVVGGLQRDRMLQMHPIDKFLQCARREWDGWRDNLKEMGFTHLPEYPYTEENTQKYCQKEKDEHFAMISRQTR